MSQKRKHRVVVEITVEEACTQKRAAVLVQDMLRLACDEDSAWPVVRVDCKQYRRVVRAEKRQDKSFNQIMTGVRKVRAALDELAHTAESM